MMNKNILIKGLLAGAIVSAVLAVSIAMCYNTNRFEASMVMGYASMAVSLLFVFFGVKKERDNNDGVITFGKAFKTGILISFIASTMYVLTWLVDYYLFIPDFMERYTSYMMEDAAAKGASQAEIAAKTSEMARYREMYKNPVWVILFTYLEIFPVGLVMSLIAALVFRRKQKRVGSEG